MIDPLVCIPLLRWMYDHRWWLWAIRWQQSAECTRLYMYERMRLIASIKHRNKVCAYKKRVLMRKVHLTTRVYGKCYVGHNIVTESGRHTITMPITWLGLSYSVVRIALAIDIKMHSRNIYRKGVPLLLFGEKMKSEQGSYFLSFLALPSPHDH